MQQLSPEYLAEIARQIIFISAFLGGCATTFLGTLLFANSQHRYTGWAIGASALSACAFIVAVFALTMLLVTQDPNAPVGMASASSVLAARLVGLLSFVVGMYSLLTCIGLSGWLRSRRLGWTTTIISLFSLFIATWTIVG